LRGTAVSLVVHRMSDHSAVRKSIDEWARSGSLDDQARSVVVEARRIVGRRIGLLGESDVAEVHRVAHAIVNIAESLAPPPKKLRRVRASARDADDGITVEAHLPRLSKRKSEEVRSAVDATLRSLGYKAEWVPRVRIIGGKKKQE
jgi:hypothetical protein